MLRARIGRLGHAAALRHRAVATSTAARAVVSPGAGLADTFGMPAPNISLSPGMLAKVSRHLLQGIDLMVCDMAGTTVSEGGIVYETLQQAMIDDGLKVSNEDMHPWHGAKKEQVIAHFAQLQRDGAEVQAAVDRISEVFIQKIEKAYFSDASPLALIDPGLLSYFQQLRASGVKVGLDTGYPPEIQQSLINALNMGPAVDAYVSSYQVAEGRPYPYMIYRLMERCGISSAKRVCKVGDSQRDMQMGRNAGCGLVVGVLSGADTAEQLLQAGAHVIADKITDLPIPLRTGTWTQGLRLPDLS